MDRNAFIGAEEAKWEDAFPGFRVTQSEEPLKKTGLPRRDAQTTAPNSRQQWTERAPHCERRRD